LRCQVHARTVGSRHPSYKPAPQSSRSHRANTPAGRRTATSQPTASFIAAPILILPTDGGFLSRGAPTTPSSSSAGTNASCPCFLQERPDRVARRHGLNGSPFLEENS
jgi:hypothetical protein